jgi:ABC-2 type transport system ATP-binding protein
MVVHLENISKKYGRFDALRGLRFRVPEGSVFALFGANGAGKTTTIRESKIVRTGGSLHASPGHPRYPPR